MHSTTNLNNSSLSLEIKKKHYRELLQLHNPPYYDDTVNYSTKTDRTLDTTMSDAGFSVLSTDSLDVRSKIASFEAFNEGVRSGGESPCGSPDRRSNAGLGSPARSVAGSSSGKLQRSFLSTEEEVEPRPIESTTSVASQNRKSRLQRATRQPQPEPGSLMQKRLAAKQQRLASLQHPSTQQKQKRDQDQQQQQQQRREQRQPSSRNVGSPSRAHSPTTKNNKTLTSPSSLSNTRASPSHNRNTDNYSPSSGSQQNRNKHSSSPNMMRAAAAANQHRANNYANNYTSNSSGGGNSSSNNDGAYQNHQHEQLKANASSDSKGSLSRFHKLKMKGMDHARLNQKRKQAAQKTNDTQDRGHQQQRQTSPYNSSSTSRQPQQQVPQQSPHRGHIDEQPAQQHHPIKSQDSPDQQLTDDDATLTSVARILDQEQAFSQTSGSRNGSITHQQNSNPGTPSNGIPGKPPLLWSGGEEKSDKILLEHHHQQQNDQIYPRPSSSSEFEATEIGRRRGNGTSQNNPFSKSSGAESNTPSPQQQSRQTNAQHQQQQYWQQPYPNYHQQQQQPMGGGGSYYQTSSQSPSHNYRQQQQYSPHHHHQGGMMSSSPQDRLRRSNGSYPNNGGGGNQPYYQSSAGARMDDDERTFDYGVRDDDDDSQGSTTFQQQLLEAERKAREQSHLSEGNNTTASMSQQSIDSLSGRRGKNGRNNKKEPSLLKTGNPMDQYRQNMENPAFKTAAGVIGAATVGCLMIGPVGMIVGAAAVGIGIGFSQIPEEQRTNMAEKATETMNKVHEQALSASEVLSNSCAATYKDSGIADHIPEEMNKFCAVSEDDVDPVDMISPDIKSEDSEAVRLDQAPCGGGVGGELPMLMNQEARKPTSPNQTRSLRNKKVACLRHGKCSIEPWCVAALIFFFVALR